MHNNNLIKLVYLIETNSFPGLVFLSGGLNVSRRTVSRWINELKDKLDVVIEYKSASKGFYISSWGLLSKDTVISSHKVLTHEA
jgi:hypothetical protein